MTSKRLSIKSDSLLPQSATLVMNYNSCDSCSSPSKQDLLPLLGEADRREHTIMDIMKPSKQYYGKTTTMIAVAALLVLLVRTSYWVVTGGEPNNVKNYSSTSSFPTWTEGLVENILPSFVKQKILQQEANQARMKLLDYDDLLVGWSSSQQEHGLSLRGGGGAEKDNDDEQQIKLKASPKNEVQPGCEGTVLLVPPCEKSSLDKEHCNYIGYERAVYLSTLFGPTPHERYPPPSYLIAESPGDRRQWNRKNVRELETIQPLADKFNLTMLSSFSTLDMHALQRHVIHALFHNSGDMCGKLMVISWKHVKIPRVAAALGCGLEQGCPLDFDFDSKNHNTYLDHMLQIKFVYRNPNTLPGHDDLNDKDGDVSEPSNIKDNSHHHHHHPYKWLVFGSIQQQGFDPLAFSKQAGDYPVGGTPTGARWGGALNMNKHTKEDMSTA